MGNELGSLSLGALRAFEAAARLGGMTAAARALGVTQGAVSRQVHLLERQLGLALFRREGRRVTLTEAGRQLAGEAGDAFQRLSEACARLRRQGRDLTLIVTPSFAVRWLMPRLKDFFASHPQLQLSIVTRGAGPEERPAPLDAVIGYARGEALPPGASTVLEDWSVPLAAPAYLDETPAIAGGDLSGQRLLLAAEEAWDWRAWAEATGARLPPFDRAFRFETDEPAVQGALTGAGLLLMTRALVEPEIAAGRLLQPEGLAAARLGTYYLQPPADPGAARRFRPFRDWLLAEAALAPPQGRG